MRVLKLDATFRPIEIISWQEAFRLYFSDKVDIIEEYHDKTVNAPSGEFKIPSVIRVKKHIKKSTGKVKFCRNHIMRRDKYTCQYCGKKVAETSELTMDHIVPASKGGKKTWDNIVASCRQCNAKKADVDLEKCGMKLLSKPRIPDWTPRVYIKTRAGDPESWRNYMR
jgi:5-methylcytosine-specific restriction endonuclease McrA